MLDVLRRNALPLVASAALAALFVAAMALFAGLSASVSLGLIAVFTVVGAIVLWLASGRTIDWSAPLPRGRLFVSFVVAAIVVGAGIQLIPYGRTYGNPPITAEPPWDSPQTRELARRACFDCHSNEVDYPWYSRIAPVSWAVEVHVSGGRNKVNYSEWDRRQRDADESAKTVREGEMPPPYYTRLGAHPEARLTPEEKAALIRGLAATFGDERQSDD